MQEWMIPASSPMMLMMFEMKTMEMKMLPVSSLVKNLMKNLTIKMTIEILSMYLMYQHPVRKQE